MKLYRDLVALLFLSLATLFAFGITVVGHGCANNICKYTLCRDTPGPQQSRFPHAIISESEVNVVRRRGLLPLFVNHAFTPSCRTHFTVVMGYGKQELPLNDAGSDRSFQ